MMNWLTSSLLKLLAQKDTLPHALLLYGYQKVGQFDLASLLAKALLCDTPQATGNACLTCPSCRWFDQKSHPDLRLVLPDAIRSQQEGDKTEDEVSKKKLSEDIRLENLGDLTHFVYTSTHHSKKRVIIIYPADRLNVFAANAILKLLEEPNQETHFLMVTDHIDRILPTILSRSQRYFVSGPSQQEALDWLNQQTQTEQRDQLLWLKLSGGSPERGLDMSKIPINIREPSSFFLDNKNTDLLPLQDFCDLLQRWLHDIILWKEAEKTRFFNLDATSLKVASKLSSSVLLSLYREVKQLVRLGHHPLQHQLQIERLKFKLQEYMDPQ
jgi:DNA polymerase-3 subunit delta'